MESMDQHGKVSKRINLDYLKQFLTDELVAGDEVYELNWAGKKGGILDANSVCYKNTASPGRKRVYSGRLTGGCI